MIKRILVILFIFAANLIAQSIYSEKDVQIYDQKFSLAVERQLENQPVNIVLSEIAQSFIGTDYEASALEKNPAEKLTVNLTGLDCTTFLENALVFARLVKSGKTNFQEYQNELQKIRYRDGVLDEYPSRLHYFTDWIYDNQKKGIIEDITGKIGGEELDLYVDFMTTNRDKYRQIAKNDNYLREIKSAEDQINSRDYFYIPKNKIPRFEDKIEDGYLIAITTNINGLDVVHVGVAVKKNNGRVHLLHAPNVGQKVQITKQSLSEYLAKNKRQTGIIVLKPLEPR